MLIWHCTFRYSTAHTCTWVYACAIDFSQGFWYGTLPCRLTYTLEGAKLVTASTRAVEWYKSRAHISFLSEVIQIGRWYRTLIVCDMHEQRLPLYCTCVYTVHVCMYACIYILYNMLYILAFYQVNESH